MVGVCPPNDMAVDCRSTGCKAVTDLRREKTERWCLRRALAGPLQAARTRPKIVPSPEQRSAEAAPAASRPPILVSSFFHSASVHSPPASHPPPLPPAVTLYQTALLYAPAARLLVLARPALVPSPANIRRRPPALVTTFAAAAAAAAP